MATEIIQTFADGKLRLSRSPMIVVMLEDTAIVNDDSFRYLIEVRAWNGDITPIPTDPKITLRSIPDPSGRGLFNVAPVLQDIITPEDPEDDGIIGTAGTWAVQLKYGYTHEGETTWISNSVVSFFTDGFAKAPQMINKYDNFDDVNDSKFWLLPTKEIEVAKSFPSFIHYYRGQSPLGRAVIYTDDSGESFGSILPFTAPTTTPATIYKLPTNYDLVMALNDEVAVPNPLFNPKKYFTIQLTDAVDFTYDILKVNIAIPAFCDVEDDSIAYVNRYGVWDYIYFKGRVKESINQERTEWDRRVTTFVDNVLQYPIGTSQKGVIGVMGGLDLTLQTGFVRDHINEKMIDLMMSKTHYSFRLGQFVVLNSKKLDLKKDASEELINYIVNFSIAGNIIQNIQ